MPGQVTSDLQLVHRANAGDARAFELLYERHREWILRSARVVTGSDELAADVLQEVILYWLSLFPGFVLQGKVTSFLYPCVRHAALEALRKCGRSGPLDSAGSSHAPAATVGARPDDLHELCRAMDALSLEHREVVHLAIAEGLALTEVARHLGVPVGTVKSRLHHALAKLRANETLRKSYFD